MVVFLARSAAPLPSLSSSRVARSRCSPPLPRSARLPRRCFPRRFAFPLLSDVLLSSPPRCCSARPRSCQFQSRCGSHPSFLGGIEDGHVDRRPTPWWPDTDRRGHCGARRQFLGWPPVWNYRKNMLAASASKTKRGAEQAEAQGRPQEGRPQDVFQLRRPLGGASEDVQLLHHWKAKPAMGSYHSQPSTPKCSPGEENGKIKYAMSSLQGLCDEMQDASAAILDLDGSSSTSFFGVYDGHGGAEVALYCSRQFHVELANDPDYENNLRIALEHVYFRIDEKLKRSDEWRELAYPPRKGSLLRCFRINACFVNLLPWKAPYTGPLHEGTTACVALIRGNQIIVGNAGDSRCVLSRNGQAINLSTDHKPNHQHERERIEAAGGQVVGTDFGLYCINGKTAISRSIGDFEYKQKSLPPAEQMVTCNPGICTVDITNDTDFLLIASDGVWDVMTSQQAVDFVLQYMQSGVTDLRTICESLLDSCVRSVDNSTVILVQFKGGAKIVKWQSSGAAAVDESSEIDQVQPTNTSVVGRGGTSL